MRKPIGISGKRVPGTFFRTEAGGEPVRDWLKGLDKQDRRLIGEDIKTVEIGWPIGMPACRPMGDGLHEVRTHLANNRIARVLFYIDAKGRMVLLHGFVKKTQKNARSRFRDRPKKQKEACERFAMKSKFDYSGSSFDSFLEEEGIREEVEAAAMKRVIAWQIQQAMQAQSKSKLALAREMHTSRTQVSRLLDPTNTAISLDILARAARVLGKTVTIHFINKNLSKNKNLPRVAKAPAPAHSSDLSHR